MTIYELAALFAATIWAFSSLFTATASAWLGAIAFVQIRMVIVAIMLGIYVLIAGSWRTIGLEYISVIMLSGLIGIFIGDAALFITVNRLGPRRAAVLFSLSAPISALLGWQFLAEELTSLQVIGILVVTIGVTMAVIFGKGKNQQHHWESIKGSLWAGIIFGIIAALCQSIGALLLRPVMLDGVDPIAASALRVGVAAIFLTILVQFPIKAVKKLNPLTPKILLIVAITGFLAMGVGMTLVIFALVGGEVGIISTLSATTPAILLPLLWIKTKEVPALGAWVGAGLVIVGSGLLFT